MNRFDIFTRRLFFSLPRSEHLAFYFCCSLSSGTSSYSNLKNIPVLFDLKVKGK